MQIYAYLRVPLNEDFFIQDVLVVECLEDVRNFRQKGVLVLVSHYLLKPAQQVFLSFRILVRKLQNGKFVMFTWAEKE